MNFVLIQGGRSPAQAGVGAEGSTPADVRAEMARRIRAIGYDAWRVREFMSGHPMPHGVKFLQMQIAFAGEAISRLHSIPADFCDDRYWPDR